MPKSRDDIKHEGQHRAPWISPHYGDGGWHGTPGCLRFDPRDIQPLGDHILIELDPEPEFSSVIIKPQIAASERTSRIGTVLRVGPGARKEDKTRKDTDIGIRIPMTLKPGDRVLIGHWSDWESHDQGYAAEGPNIVICQEADVRFVIE